MTVSQEDLIKIRNSLLKVVNYLDKAIDGTKNECLHENTEELSTMGQKSREFMCIDCLETWEEDFNVEGLRNFNIRVG